MCVICIGMSPDRFCISCGSAAPLPEDHPLRDELLRIQAFTRGLDTQLGVSPQLESYVAPSLAMSTDAAAERASQPTHRDELAHSQGVLVGDGVLPLTVDTSLPGSTGIPETLQTPFLTRYDEYSTSS